MTKEQSILASNLQACSQRIEKLRYSLQKNTAFFPLTPARLASLTEVQEESIDALILRYSQCVSMMQDQLFRGIAYLEQEDISGYLQRKGLVTVDSEKSAKGSLNN